MFVWACCNTYTVVFTEFGKACATFILLWQYCCTSYCFILYYNSHCRSPDLPHHGYSHSCDSLHCMAVKSGGLFIFSQSTSPLMCTQFYLQMAMSCSSQQNCRVAHAWHSVLYLNTVLTIWKESNSFPSQLQVLKTSLKTSISFILSVPLTSHFALLLPHFVQCNAVHPALSLCPFDFIVFSFHLPRTYHSCHLLNLHSLSSSCIILHFCYLLLRLLAVTLGDYYYSPQYCTLGASKGFHSDPALLCLSLTITAAPFGMTWYSNWWWPGIILPCLSPGWY